MKYTKKYPIHPLPDKQFSGASIFAQGGQLPEDDKPKSKTYTNKAEYDKALRAYNDSLNLFEDRTVGGLKRLHNELKEGEQIPKEKIVPFNQYLGGTSYLDDRIKPVGFHKDEIEASDGYYSWHTPLYKKPVVKPEYNPQHRTTKPLNKVYRSEDNYLANSTTYSDYLAKVNNFEKSGWKKDQDLGDWVSYSSPTEPGYSIGLNVPKKPSLKLAKGTLEQEVRPTMAKGEMYSEPKPITELMMPDGTKWSKEKFVGKYGEPQWMKATGQKFANGGKLPGDDKTKTYTNKAEYDKALQAYNDSLINYKVYNSNKSLNEKTINTVGDMDLHSLFPKKENRDILPTALMRTGTDPNFAYYNKYKKPVFIPEYKEPTMTKGTMESEPKPINELMMPSGSYMQKDDFIKRYGEKPWLKATGQKFAFGGFKYNNGGTKTTVGNSFYNQSTNQVGSPQVNTVPSSYTDQFNGNYSSTPKTTKDGINFTKDGKAFNTMSTSNSGSAFSGNYLGMATAAVGGIGTTVNNANAATTEQEKNRAIERGTVDTTMNVVDAAFPIVEAVEGVAGGIGSIIDSTNGSTSYTDPNTGKTYTYKKGDSGTSAAGFKAAVDPRGNATNFIGDITGTTENYGQSNFGMAVADLFVPFLSEAFRNKQREKAANQAQLNNSLMAAKEVDSTARNFSAFGGYKNKFPYGGNMKSEVTGQSYLKDQVSDFTSNKFSKHEQGGVMVDSQNEVEAGEIVYKDYVFSDRLKDAKGNSFAARAKKLIDQIK